MAVARSGTSTENIPLPRWFTLFGDFLFLDGDDRERAGFDFLALRHAVRFTRVDFMIYLE